MPTVVINSPAIEAASCSATRMTLVGPRMPAFTRAVILGCGGFEANVQMRTQHIGPLVGGAKVRGTPHNQGDGLRMAMAIGAMPWGNGAAATPPRSLPTGATSPRANSPTEATASATPTAS